MGGNRVRKINIDVELDRFLVSDAKRLLGFNITKQRIVDLCNKEFEDDPFDEAKNYSTWHRALDGHEVWDGIVHALAALIDRQTANPRQYLPPDDPGDDLREWMAQIAKATWWHKTLQLDMPLNTLNSWFSGRVTKTRPELREKVGVWWDRVKVAADGAERYSAVHWRDWEMWQERKRPSYNPQRPVLESWDTWCKDLIEDGLSIDELRKRHVQEALMHDQHHLSLINLSDPQSPLSQGFVSEYQEGWRQQEFDALLEAGFPLALSRTPPEFDAEPFVEEKQWGDRRNEDCPKDVNTHLYGKHYRERCQRYWNAQDRRIDEKREVVQVSSDGENWREANETEKKGWDNGTIIFLEAMHADQDASNSYIRELEKAKTAVKRARNDYDRGWSDPDKEASLASAMKVAERELQVARDNTYGQ